MQKVLGILLLVCICPAWASVSTLGQVDPATQNFDGYMLALMWPRGQCATLKCSAGIVASKMSFTIHGLWPASFNPTSGVYGPQDCPTSNQFSSKKYTSAVQTSLLYLWPSMNSPHERFWKHEYEKHGSCWLPDSADMSKVPPALKQSVQTAISNKANKV